MTFKIRVDNLITMPDRLTRLRVDLDDGNIFDYKKHEIPQYFDVSYKNVGTKSFSVSAYIPSTITSLPKIYNYPNIIKVVSKYDNINVDIYSEESVLFTPPVTSVPFIYPNTWAGNTNINKCLKDIQKNLDYLISKTRYYDESSIEYIGWYGVAGQESLLECGSGNWTWSQALYKDVAWSQVLSSEPLSPFRTCSSWHAASCGLADQSATSNYNWRWVFLESDAAEQKTWLDIQNDNYTSKFHDTHWENLLCSTFTNVNTAQVNPIQDNILDLLSDSQVLTSGDCFLGARWHVVDVPGLEGFAETVGSTISCIPFNDNCVLTDIVVSDGVMFTSTNTTVRACSTNLLTTPFMPIITGIDKDVPFSNVVALASGVGNRVFVCDRENNGVACYIFKKNNLLKWGRTFSIYGIGSRANKYKFNNPTDICVDIYSNVIVNDSGNSCIKLYTYRGEWLKTISLTTAPISIAVDSQNLVHLLYSNTVQTLNLINEQIIDTYTHSLTGAPVRIRSNYNKEVLYISSSSEVTKHFRTGINFTTLDISTPNCLKHIKSVFHDENRNLYLVTNDYIVKYVDLMNINSMSYMNTDSSKLLVDMWSVDEVIIDAEEYMQDWVFTRAFQRMYENIELFRSSLMYSNVGCDVYGDAPYQKSDIFVGQNEIVTSAVVNRCLKYLWSNLTSLYKYFDTSC